MQRDCLFLFHLSLHPLNLRKLLTNIYHKFICSPLWTFKIELFVTSVYLQIWSILYFHPVTINSDVFVRNFTYCFLCTYIPWLCPSCFETSGPRFQIACPCNINCLLKILCIIVLTCYSHDNLNIIRYILSSQDSSPFPRKCSASTVMWDDWYYIDDFKLSYRKRWFCN